MELIGGLLVLSVFGAIYFAPAIAAGLRDHPNTPSITVLNLFLGWTFVGWVAALVWALKR